MEGVIDGVIDGVTVTDGVTVGVIDGVILGVLVIDGVTLGVLLGDGSGVALGVSLGVLVIVGVILGVILGVGGILLLYSSHVLSPIHVVYPLITEQSLIGKRSHPILSGYSTNVSPNS